MCMWGGDRKDVAKLARSHHPHDPSYNFLILFFQVSVVRSGFVSLACSLLFYKALKTSKLIKNQMLSHCFLFMMAAVFQVM